MSGMWMRGVMLVSVGSLLWAGCGKAQDTAVQPDDTGGSTMAVTVGDGTQVKLDYTLKVEGQVVDSSQGREPLSYVHGQGQIIPGLERELTGMHSGDSKHVSIAPQDGYGQVDPNAFIQISKERLPQDAAPEVGQQLRGMAEDGRPFQARIAEIGEEQVTLDLNHPLAGKTLEFDVAIVDVSPKP